MTASEIAGLIMEAGPAGFLSDMAMGTLQLLVDPGTMRSFSAGEAVIRPDASPPTGGIVLAGLMRVYLAAPDGRRLTISYARAGSLVGIVTALAGPRIAASVEALTDGEMLELEVAHIRSVAMRDPAFAWSLAQEASRRLVEGLEAAAHAALSPPRARLARLLLELATIDPDAGALVVRATQQSLAEGIGTVREVVARNLGAMRADGLLRTGRDGVVLSDPARLATIAGRWLRTTDEAVLAARG